MNTSRRAPALFVIFGGTGDLAKRKLLPALGRLEASGQLGAVHVLGVARDDRLGDASYRALGLGAMLESGVAAEAVRDLCDHRLHYQSIGDRRREDFAALGERIAAVEETHGLMGNRVFYLALPTAVIESTAAALGEVGLSRGPGFTRLVMEKPFGRDLASARALVAALHRHFTEEQIFRIDHYLGKETVQNLLAFRFGNPIFEALWNRDRIDAVQITASEPMGVGTRAGYYDGVGATRDMVQNHLTQLLCLLAMEVPPIMDAEAVRYEKIKVLRSVAPIEPGDAVFGRYEPGVVGGLAVPGYLEEPGVAAGSVTETFAAMRLHIHNWRWQGVPFFLRTGKRLSRRFTRVGVRFRPAPVCMFESDCQCTVQPNLLLLTLQPEEGFSLHIGVKRPGSVSALEQIPLTFRYSDVFPEMAEAYQTLLLDVLAGDQTLFVHSDEVLASWAIFDPILARSPKLATYAAGSRGPREAESLALPERDLVEDFSTSRLCEEDQV